MAAPGYRIGADIGGTFTDLVFCRGDGSIRVRKLPSSPEDYARPVLEAVGAFLAEERLGGEAVSELVHGTTVATNAILQRAGARTGLLTTRGFRDVLEIRRVRLPKLYDLTWEKPPPLVPRRLRLEVDERLDARGQVVRPLSEGSAQEAIRELSAQGVESVAVCFLHAYANDAHERRLEELLREMLPGVPVSLSSRVLPKMREYERTATTVVNAYLQPLVQGYLENLQAGLRAAGLGAPLRLMQSNGGLLSAGVTTERPVHLVESGPAAGVIAALGVARQMDMQNALTLDVGGTTAKASIIEGGELSWTAEIEVGAEISRGSRLIKGAGYPIGLPTVDIAEVGAGGGSVAWLEAGGTLRVGPGSAGANPGPACYGLGGAEPTVTDADLVLGYLNPDFLAGGTLRLHPDLAREAIARRIAEPLGMGPLEVAHGIHRVANANLIRAIRSISVERGRDPRDFALIAFGGSGPVHAAELARELGMRRVVIPPHPGLFSAFGLLSARLERHAVRTYLGPLAGLDPDQLGIVLEALEDEARDEVWAAGGEEVTLARSVDLRYRKQVSELTLPLPDGALRREDLDRLVEAFGVEHERIYGYRAAGAEVEMVALRVTAQALGEGGWPVVGAKDASRTGGPTPGGERPVYFGPEAGSLPTPVLSRLALGRVPRPGPLIVEEYDATAVVPPGFTARLDAEGNLLIEGGAREEDP